MLSTSDDARALNTLNGLGELDTGQNRVWTAPRIQPASFAVLAQRQMDVLPKALPASSTFW